MGFNPFDNFSEPSKRELEKEAAAKAAKIEAKKKADEEWYNTTYLPVKNIEITTCDITSRKYKIIRPCFYQVSNKGLLADKLSKEISDKFNNKYFKEIRQETEYGDSGILLYGENSVGQADFEKAFAVAIMSMKKQAYLAGGNAVIGYKQDIDIDTNGGHNWFYFQCYGTIVKYLD